MIHTGEFATSISVIGHGKYFIRSALAYDIDIAALMKYKGLSLSETGEEVVKNRLVDMGWRCHLY